MKDLEEIKRLIGDAPRPGTLEDINATLEKNLEFIFKKFDSKVDVRVRELVNQVVEAAMGRASAFTSPDITKQINDLKSEVGVLRSQLTEAIKALKDAAGGRGGGRHGGGTTADAALQIGKKENMLAWKTSMKFNSNWNDQQRTNYNCLLKVCNPNEHKCQQKAFFHKKIEEPGK